MTQAKDTSQLIEFIQKFSDAFTQNQLLRLVLSRYEGPQSDLLRLQIRPILLKTGTQLSVLFENKTFDQTKNFSLDEILPLLVLWLGPQFKAALLECNGKIGRASCSERV